MEKNSQSFVKSDARIRLNPTYRILQTGAFTFRGSTAVGTGYYGGYNNRTNAAAVNGYNRHES